MTPLSKPVPKWLIGVLVAVAVIGFADATFLTIEHYRSVIPPCTTDGCETVLTSSYSTIVGIPVALFGSLYYLALLVLLITYLDTKKERFLKIALLLTTLGFLASIYFLILQAFVIHAYCQYCLVSAATSTILFIISMTVLKRYYEKL